MCSGVKMDKEDIRLYSQLWSKVENLNDRTKIHTRRIQDLEKEFKKLKDEKDAIRKDEL